MCAGVSIPPNLMNSKAVDQLFLVCYRNTERGPTLWDEALPGVQRYMPNMCPRMRGVICESSWAVYGIKNTCVVKVGGISHAMLLPPNDSYLGISPNDRLCVWREDVVEGRQTPCISRYGGRMYIMVFWGVWQLRISNMR